MKTLVVGASGATGQLLVDQLLKQGHSVKIIVRSMDALKDTIKKSDNVSIILASILDLSDDELAEHVKDCDAVASCLGHNINFKGVFGFPRRLVTDATRRLCHAIEINKPVKPVRFVLMNSSGVSNPALSEKISFKQQIVICLLRFFIPPHVDNEKAANYLLSNIGKNSKYIQWSSVRPDALIDNDAVTHYSIHPSPVRSAIFDAGSVSRMNVAHFMSELITDDDVWEKWQTQMPVIYSECESLAAQY